MANIGKWRNSSSIERAAAGGCRLALCAGLAIAVPPLFPSSPVHAEEKPAVQALSELMLRQTFLKRASAYAAAALGRDPVPKVAFMPVKLRKRVAALLRIDLESAEAELAQALSEQEPGLMVVAMTLHDQAPAPRLLAGHRPVRLIPTEVRFTLLGEPGIRRETTLALFDEGEWYFVSVRGAGIGGPLLAAYPELKEIAGDLAAMRNAANAEPRP